MKRVELKLGACVSRMVGDSVTVTGWVGAKGVQTGNRIRYSDYLDPTR